MRPIRNRARCPFLTPRRFTRTNRRRHRPPLWWNGALISKVHSSWHQFLTRPYHYNYVPKIFCFLIPLLFLVLAELLIWDDVSPIPSPGFDFSYSPQSYWIPILSKLLCSCNVVENWDWSKNAISRSFARSIKIYAYRNEKRIIGKFNYSIPSKLIGLVKKYNY